MQELNIWKIISMEKIIWLSDVCLYMQHNWIVL